MPAIPMVHAKPKGYWFVGCYWNLQTNNWEKWRKWSCVTKLKLPETHHCDMNKHFPVAQTRMCPVWVNARSPDTQWHLLFYSTDQPKPHPCPHSFQFWVLLQPTDKPLFNCTFEYLIMWFPDNDAIISSSSCNMYNHIICICLSVKEAEEIVLF